MSMKKTISRVLGGNAISQLIMILTTPILARIYDISHFGELATVNAILLTIGVVSCFRYDQLIFQFKNKEKWNVCVNRAFVSSLITLSFSFVIALLVYLFLPNIQFYLVLLLPVMIWMFGISMLFSSILSIEGKYEKITNSVVIKSIAVFLFQYISYYLFELNGLILGLFIGTLLQSSYLFLYCHGWFHFNYKWNLRFQVKNSLASTLQSLFNSTSSQIPSFFIPLKYGMDMMGVYSMALRLTYIPINFITNALRPVVLGEFNSKKENTSEVYKILLNGSLALIFTGIVGILLINFFAEDFFEFYIGDSWRISGKIASILSFWIMLGFSNILAVCYLTVYSRFKFLLFYDGLLLVFRLGAAAISFGVGLGFFDFVKVYSVLGFLFNMSIIFISIWFARNERNTHCYNC
ncbi:oligosaccharide flippase family protein [Vibrio parahaemolyticus]|nr:oligosaccharide flippase family protein [Vibrio parahaemolyticus]EGQ8939437.1 oligosaccharide flippase family protein [Vibrio parahaemolyticus]EGQ8949041.1 oligosaccharide flippase family protein [Vibrio parahaemolyticus]EGQ8954708.1 oligosaccharide flippase family protein [Vibrio parahaemolyticus]EGQ8969624.1 oligosaccharide flippase family protein [Vibrio parahaemolyticus]